MIVIGKLGWFFSKIAGYWRDPVLFLRILLVRFGKCLPDRLYLQWLYRLRMGKKLDLDNPKTFNEKLQWLKLYNRKPEYTIMADKVKVKEWVAERIGEEYIIPTLGVWERVEDIDFDQLPDRFVLKCNHNSGTGMYICKEKSKMDRVAVVRELKKGLAENYFLHGREWVYKDIPRRVIAEQFMEDPQADDLTDYKFFCFQGKPFMMYVSKDHAQQAYTDFYDMDYNRLPIRMKDPNSENPPAKPVKFEEMKALACKLSQGTPHLRVDFYVVNHRIYFGELTFYHNGGLGPISPLEWNLRLGSMIDLELE